MRPFEARGSRYVARLDEVERRVVAQLAADVAELLGATPAQLAEASGGGEGLWEEAGTWGEEEPEDRDEDDVVLLGEHAGPDLEGPTPWDEPAAPSVDALLVALDPASTPEEPLDPALRRLLPTASEDPEVATEYRRLTQVDLRALKVGRLLALVRALRQGEHLVVPKERADLLGGALVDIRLVIAERLGVSSDEDADALYEELAEAEQGHRPRTPGEALRLHLAAAYSALTWLQESLVTAQLAELDASDA